MNHAITHLDTYNYTILSPTPTELPLSTTSLFHTAIMPLLTVNHFPLSSELQGLDTGMVSYDGTVYASLETGVATGAGKFT